jgi:hypothetical protein
LGAGQSAPGAFWISFFVLVSYDAKLIVPASGPARTATPEFDAIVDGLAGPRLETGRTTDGN